MIFVFPTVLYYYNRPSLFCQPLLQKFCPPFFAGRGLSSAKTPSFRDFATHGCLHTRENSPPVCRLQSRLKNAEPRKIASLPRLFCEKPLQYPCRYAILYASFARIIRAKHGGVLKWPKRSVLKTERSFIATRGFNSLHLRHKKAHICLPDKCVLFSTNFALVGK